MPTENKQTALFISPHLDDVVFSCGATLAKLSEKGWKTILCTIFTKSVLNPVGFALACQLDKNIAPHIDYMKLRRAEDFRAAKSLNADEILHLNFAEAPHRGYETAAALFAGEKADDCVWRNIAEHLKVFDEIHQPELVFAPQGLGNHVDHLQTIRAVRESITEKKILWYRDTPYAIRQPKALPSEILPKDLNSIFVEIEQFLPQKIAACAAYESQINFQFGGNDQLKQNLTEFHRAEASRATKNDIFAEIYASSRENLEEGFFQNFNA